MIINKKYIRSIQANLSEFIGHHARFGVLVEDVDQVHLQNMGFTTPFTPGQTLLPKKSYGSISRFNAEGKYLIHRDKPKETRSRQIMWKHVEFHGDTRIEVEDSRDVEYKAYPRTLIPPPSIELSLMSNTSGQILVVTPEFLVDMDRESEVCHAVNLILELFKVCRCFNSALAEVVVVPLVRVNWRILPPGQYPWSVLKTQVAQVIENAPKGNRTVIENRLEAVNNHKPDFVAVGQAGFTGYLIFGFPQKELCTRSGRLVGMG